MAWDIRKTYYYLVCFATLLMLVVGAVQTVQNTLDLLLPSRAYAPSRFDLYERYRMRGEEGDREPAFTREELDEMAREEAVRMERDQRRMHVRDLIGNLALLLIAAPIYRYHWRQVRRTEE